MFNLLFLTLYYHLCYSLCFVFIQHVYHLIYSCRLQGGKDAASARYLYTRLQPYTRMLFPKEDDYLLNYLQEDGQSVQPIYYLPIIPLVLINGIDGVGTGWSTSIPC